MIYAIHRQELYLLDSCIDLVGSFVEAEDEFQ